MEIAVVTGTRTGIGLATSLHLARIGYRVFAGMRNLAKADALRDAAAAEDLSVEVIEIDVTSELSTKGAFEAVRSAGPPPYSLVAHRDRKRPFGSRSGTDCPRAFSRPAVGV